MPTSTSDRASSAPTNAFVWVWLPGAAEPVVAGRVSLSGDGYRFAYGNSYLERPDRISLFTPELPLMAGWIDPPEGMDMAGCLWDASPDSWGQRVIIARLTGLHGAAADRVSFDKLTFLLESGSNRIGGLDFQHSATEYVPRSEQATLDELHAAAAALESGELRPELAAALVDGTSVGGARPKVLVAEGERHYIAKLSMSSDLYPVVEAAADYDLSVPAAKEIIDRQVSIIREQWPEACEQCELSATERRFLLGRQVLNAYAFDGW